MFCVQMCILNACRMLFVSCSRMEHISIYSMQSDCLYHFVCFKRTKLDDIGIDRGREKETNIKSTVKISHTKYLQTRPSVRPFIRPTNRPVEMSVLHYYYKHHPYTSGTFKLMFMTGQTFIALLLSYRINCGMNLMWQKVLTLLTLSQFPHYVKHTL